jgi:hypothetical protein
MPTVNLSPIFNGWQGFSLNGIPLAGGLINTYQAGTVTPLATYTTNVGNVANANPIQLDAAGHPPFEIWLIQGQSYKFVLTDSLGLNPFTYDNIVGVGDEAALLAQLADTSNVSNGAALVGRAQQTVDSIAALRLLLKTSASKYAFVTGYYAAGDGGGGPYYYDAADTTSADDGGSIIVAADGGRWKLSRTSYISVKQFGAKGDGTNNDTSAINNATIYLNANVWAASFNYQQGGGTLFFPKGVYRTTATVYTRPFVRWLGEGRDGWTGGSPGYGVTAAASPPDGSIIFADFGATTNACAIDTVNYAVAGGAQYTSMTPIALAQLGGTYTYCQNVGIEKMGVFCTNSTQIGIRFQGSAESSLKSVSVLGFLTSVLSNCCWSYTHTDLHLNGTQISYAAISNLACSIQGNFDCNGFSGSPVTVGNKPLWWSANDTNYQSTSLYLINCTGVRYPEATSQHCGRALWAEATDVSFGMFYIEDVPFVGSGDTPGQINGYNAAASNNSILIEAMEFIANGATVFNNLTNVPVTLLSFAGIQGNMLGATISGTTNLILGNNVNRNNAFGDFAFNSKIISLVPTTGTWTPGLTNVGGTGITAAGFWTRRGNIYDCDVVITGTALTATGGGATVLTTPFNGTGGFAAPARASGVAVTTANLQAASGLMDTNANLYISAITSTTRIVISFQLFGV